MKKVTRNYKGIIQIYDYKGKKLEYDALLNIRISNDMKEKLKQKAKDNGTTLSNFIKSELEKVIDE